MLCGCKDVRIFHRLLQVSHLSTGLILHVNPGQPGVATTGLHSCILNEHSLTRNSPISRCREFAKFSCHIQDHNLVLDYSWFTWRNNLVLRSTLLKPALSIFWVSHQATGCFLTALMQRKGQICHCLGLAEVLGGSGLINSCHATLALFYQLTSRWGYLVQKDRLPM